VFGTNPNWQIVLRAYPGGWPKGKGKGAPNPRLWGPPPGSRILTLLIRTGAEGLGKTGFCPPPQKYQTGDHWSKACLQGGPAPKNWHEKRGPGALRFRICKKKKKLWARGAKGKRDVFFPGGEGAWGERLPTGP